MLWTTEPSTAKSRFPGQGTARDFFLELRMIHDVAVPVDESGWYREIKSSMTAGDTVKADRGLRGWTQKKTAGLLGISVQNLSEIERDVRPVSRKMAVKLAEVFGTSPEAYFRFGGRK